eukprot:CAMPEP_0197237370 /NCGR_PEP_ID=MMETSP1429-20130617/4217_1 /TAXON_ID=49237 /ORGANISM="Chaetoceros  sp., Strain UNC1202" /LENGTH=528 /DNA_ID=CAMNT_0042696353 /DNA_START=95 /DNA_END=1681 /DNA_ORIENTATION=+
MPSLSRSIAAAVLFGSSAVAGFGTPDHVSSRLQIQVPKTLFKEGGYDHREALFGSPPYGGSIAQNIYYTDDDLCDARAVDPTTGYPSRAIDMNTNKQQPWPSPFILMVDRGGCSFVQKARNAQHAGAAGVVIADNMCLCNDLACLNITGVTQPCQHTEPIMADDGSGGDITIPAFLMFKADAIKIIEEVKDHDSPVQIEMSWSLPHPDTKVEYELWTVPSDEVSKDFQKKWKDVATKMGNKLFFTPRQYIYDGIKSRCQTGDGRNMCFNLCTNNGRYCATDPDNDLDHGITGAEVVKEALRRICIWKQHGEQDGIGVTYWNYIAEFLTRCDSDDFFASEDCVKDAFKHAKIDKKMIDQCMDASGGLTDDGPNNLLDREVEAAGRRGVVVLPTMFVNSAPLRGALTSNTVFNAVCAGFVEGSEPSVCNKCRGCSDTAQCVKKGSCKSYENGNGGGGSGGVSKKTFGATLLFMCALFGVAGYIHWRKTREEMRDQVRGILAEYMPLEGGDEEGSSPMDFARRGQSASLIS